MIRMTVMWLGGWKANYNRGHLYAWTYAYEAPLGQQGFRVTA